MNQIQYEYKVLRYGGSENTLKDKLMDQGAGGWILCGFTFQSDQTDPYLCVLCRPK